MTEEKQKQEEDEVTEEQLNDVAGGLTAERTLEPMSLSKQWDASTPELMRDAIQGNAPGSAELDFVRIDDDEDDWSK